MIRKIISCILSVAISLSLIILPQSVDAKNSRRRRNFKQNFRNEHPMANRRKIFFAVAKIDDNPRQYLDRRALYAIDVFGDFNEYSQRLLRGGEDRRSVWRAYFFQRYNAVYATSDDAVPDNAICRKYQ